MRKSICTVLILFTSFLIAEGRRIPFKRKYTKEYKRALSFVKTNKSFLKHEIKKYKLPPKLLLSIVFPELIRYSIYFDKVEFLSLKVFYINLGEGYADFSVGKFQMKPSFVTYLEEQIQNKKWKHLLAYRKTSAKEIRRERVKRLESLAWQIKYLAAFYEYTNTKYKTYLRHKSKAQQVRFLAAAYNCGIEWDAEDILDCSQKSFFPHGTFGPGSDKNYNYSKVARSFYLKERW
ncbi:MAG: hypothetical protein AAF518_21270 [Spirochaetota bacterium]